ncbi:hypothetical protein [Nocardiopsis sp. NPDC057823]|uniref:hypothetical protein n=1 Tax=Nocardiopsis sp. NPDC057823 TaxID=3346256 RepID=UPI00367044CD
MTDLFPDPLSSGRRESTPDRERVLQEATAALPVILRDFHGCTPAPVPPVARRPTADILLAFQDRNGIPFTLRTEAVPLPSGEVGRVHVNSSSQNHVLQIAQDVRPNDVGMALAYESGELFQVREDTAADLSARRDSFFLALDRSRDTRLSPEDAGRVGELNWLAHIAHLPDASPDLRRAARDGFSNRLDVLALREDSPSWNGAPFPGWERIANGHALSSQAHAMYRELGVPLRGLPERDAAALRAFRESREQDTGRLLTPSTSSAALLDPTGSRPDKRDLAEMARRSGEVRARKSDQTVEALRRNAEALPEGSYPKVSLMIGGGAALAGRSPDQLVVDGKGRWHVDPIRGIVQSAEQVRHLPKSGLGDPAAFVGPNDRVPLDAIRLWENEAAVKGPVVDGHAALSVDDQGRLLATITPAGDRGDPVTVEVKGTPVVATGVPPEIIPGASRSIPTLPEATQVLADEIRRSGIPESLTAAERLKKLPDTPGSAQEALETAERFGVGSHSSKDMSEAMKTLKAVDTWDRASQDAPGRLLIGDDVGDGRYDPNITDEWLIAGAGGAAIANAEIILEANPNARVTMVGGQAPWVLSNDAQYLTLRQKHDREHGGDGRLSVHDARLEAVETSHAPDGSLRFHAAGHTGGAYVACLGRVARAPKVLDPVRDWCRENGGEVTGRLITNNTGQYLGYELNYRTEEREIKTLVTGAASRMLPSDIFSAKQGQEIERMGAIEAPSESGNVAAGFMATAIQGSHLKQNRQNTNSPHQSPPTSPRRTPNNSSKPSIERD